jgi:hypothetical protein
MEEAGASYRALGPIVVLEWLRHATIAHAARFVGADWSHLAGPAGPAGARGATPSSTAASRIRRWLPAAATLGVCLLVLLAVVMAGGVTPDSRVLPQRLTLDQRTVTTARTGLRPLTHVVGPVHRGGGAGERPSRLPVQAGALAGVAHVPSSRAIVHKAVTKHDRHVTRHTARHGSHSSPPPTTNDTPTTPPVSTTPTTTTPAPSPPSGGSSGSTGSGTGTSTGGGETTSTTETPPGPPGGEPAKTTTGCALAIAC